MPDHPLSYYRISMTTTMGKLLAFGAVMWAGGLLGRISLELGVVSAPPRVAAYFTNTLIDLSFPVTATISIIGFVSYLIVWYRHGQRTQVAYQRELHRTMQQSDIDSTGAASQDSSDSL